MEKGMEYSNYLDKKGIATYALVACLAMYVVLVIVDAVICRQKVQKAYLATMLQVVDDVD